MHMLPFVMMESSVPLKDVSTNIARYITYITLGSALLFTLYAYRVDFADVRETVQ